MDNEYNKWCYSVCNYILPTSVFVCRCKIDEYVEEEGVAWVSTEYGERELLCVSDLFDTYEDAEKSCIEFLEDALVEVRDGIFRVREEK